MPVKKPAFITKPYSGYYHTEVPEDDKELTRVGPGTPAGEYLRRFWQPILVAQQVRESPLVIMRFCEELVAFRDKSGRVGLLQLHCSRCGTSLGLGEIEEDGIRCRRDGWKFGIDGRPLDTPGTPPDNNAKDKFCHGAYPATEHGGIVFTYMGPPEKMPDFPRLDIWELPGYHMEPGRHLKPTEDGPVPNPKPCNWLQVVDNFVDPLHENILHATISGIQFIDNNGRPVEELAIEGEGKYLETPTSIITMDVRRITDETVWVRNIEWVWPNAAVTGGSRVFPHEWGPGETEVHNVPLLVLWGIPVDDYNTVEIDMLSVPDGKKFEYSKVKSPALAANMGERDYEEMQRFPGDYEANIGQRTIARHSLEHLAVSDRGVILMRKGLRRGIKAVQGGGDPPELKHMTGRKITTYGGDFLLKIERTTNPEEDKELIGGMAVDVAKRYIQEPPNLLPPA